MGMNDWLPLRRLRRAVKKIGFILNFNIVNKWKLACMIGSSSSKRGLSFNYRQGLMVISDDYNNVSDSGSSHSVGLHRTASCISDDDIDKKAETFIANFRKQLQIERQISLDLQYCRGKSFESAASESHENEFVHLLSRDG